VIENKGSPQQNTQSNNTMSLQRNEDVSGVAAPEASTLRHTSSLSNISEGEDVPNKTYRNHKVRKSSFIG
jgi:hypothetical protein